MVRPDPALGVFETMLVRDGVPLELGRHLARLTASLNAVYGADVPDTAVSLVEAEASGHELARLRLTVAPAGRGTFGADVTVRPVEPAMVLPGPDGALELVPLVVEGGLGAHKWVDRSLVEPAERDSGSGSVPLLIDVDDTVLEVSRGNVFLVEGASLVTPPLDGRILPGIVRGLVLEQASAHGLTATDEPVPLDRLLAAQEIFVTGSVRGIEPVRCVRGGPERRPGSSTAALASVLQALWFPPAGAVAP